MTASIAAFDGQTGQVAYAAAKAGIVGMTLPAARDLSEIGVRVCSIAPGTFDTQLLAGLPQAARDGLATTMPFPRRLGRPSEFADLVTSVVRNRMINGETIRIDGALRMPFR
jgi:NAD(P)-dependent dehydrogenase (short-subunit alcohol dehydrogenase family)